MEIRINVDDEYMKSLIRSLKESKATDVARDALTLLNWAVSEVKAGRVILSAQKDGSNIHRLAMPALERAGKIEKVE